MLLRPPTRQASMITNENAMMASHAGAGEDRQIMV
jgi:hypothetical protein